MEIGNIKFKAKKTLDGKWIKGDLVHHKDSDNVWMTDYKNQLTSPVNPYTVCQFTGLKDCKGNEIWEGDIAECETYDLYKGFIKVKAIIEYMYGAFVAIIDGSLILYTLSILRLLATNSMGRITYEYSNFIS